MKSITLIILLFGFVAVACGTSDSDDDIPDPQPDTPDIIATVDENPQPTIDEPSPLPTLTVTPSPVVNTPDPALISVEGTWNMLLDFELREGSLLDVIDYSAAAAVTVVRDGTVFGSGSFAQSISYQGCSVQLLNLTGLTFTITGEVVQEGDTYFADITLVPDDPGFVEQYRTLCENSLATPDVHDINAPILWRLLGASDQLSYTIDLSQNFGVRAETEFSVAELTNNELDGTLTGQVYFGR